MLRRGGRCLLSSLLRCCRSTEAPPPSPPTQLSDVSLSNSSLLGPCVSCKYGPIATSEQWLKKSWVQTWVFEISSIFTIVTDCMLKFELELMNRAVGTRGSISLQVQCFLAKQINTFSYLNRLTLTKIFFFISKQPARLRAKLKIICKCNIQVLLEHALAKKDNE